jgi:hypothetical protein
MASDVVVAYVLMIGVEPAHNTAGAPNRKETNYFYP